MKGLVRRIKERLSRSEAGQALIIFVFAFVALLAMVGIALDAGVLYIQYSHLRRAVDAGLLAAVSQYREGRTPQEVYNIVLETVQLQLPDAQNVRFYWCQQQDHQGMPYDPYDPSLCTDPPRKLVRVEAQLPVNLVFLRLVWGDQVIIRNEAQAEAAVLNLVLLLDTSESMAYESCNPHWPEPLFFQCLLQCRENASCRPFDAPHPEPSIRRAAAAFVSTLMRDGVDRFAVYHFDRRPVISQTVERFPCITPFGRTVMVTATRSSGRVISLTTNKAAVLAAINDPRLMNIYVRPRACGPDNTGQWSCCESPLYVGGDLGEEGLGYGYRWASTNIGGGLREAVGELVNNGTTDAAVWVIVLLSDGAANMTDQAADENGWWTCPSPIGSGFPQLRSNRGPGGTRVATCRDRDNPPGADGVLHTTRHCPSVAVCTDTRMCRDPNNCARTSWYTNWGTTNTLSVTWHYDADDYARDIADLAAFHRIVMYSIGFKGWIAGDGEELLRYIADVGDDGSRYTAPCGSDRYWDNVVVDPPPAPLRQCGNYYYAADLASLEKVFEDIAGRIFARIIQ